jgi:hypothetical protein
MSATFLEAVHADPWADDFADLATLNAGASDAIEASVQRLREVARAEPHALRSSSMVVLGPPGAGKTHLFSRLRRRLGPRAVFVHIRPLVHGEMTPRFILSETVRQLAYATHGLPQLNALVGSLLAHLNGEDTSFPNAFLSEYQSLSPALRDERLEDALERVLATWKEADESYLRRLLRAPFANAGEQRALLAWLSGRDCDVSQLQRIGATASLSDELCPAALRTLSAVAALGAPIVLVFDQLENLVDASGSRARLVAYGNLASELVDAMRGLLLVHMALDTEWSHAIEPVLNLSQRSRVIMARQTLSLPNEKQREELLRIWLDKLPQRDASYPWPFSQAGVERLRRAPGLTPRMLLVELRRALDGETSIGDADASEPSETASALSQEWQGCLTAARKLLDEATEQRTTADAERVADGLLACGRFLSGAELASTAVRGPAQLQLSSGTSSQHVAFLHQTNPKSLGTALVKLTALSADKPVLALRERAHDLPPTWKDTRSKRAALLATGRARWVELERDDAARLLALDELMQGARSGDIADARGRPVGEDVVCDWVRATLSVTDWPIARALLAGGDAEADDVTPIETERELVIEDERVALGLGVSLMVLSRLRLASLDRVVREVARVDPTSTRASVVRELEANADRVRFFGRNIVCARYLP